MSFKKVIKIALILFHHKKSRPLFGGNSQSIVQLQELVFP